MREKSAPAQDPADDAQVASPPATQEVTDSVIASKPEKELKFEAPQILSEEVMAEDDIPVLADEGSDRNAEPGKMAAEEYYSVKGDVFLGDTIVLVQEKMITGGAYNVYRKDEDLEKEMDSAKVSRSFSRTLQVEFWRSPINYRGYRFNAKKLLLFGFADTSVQGIFELEGQFYLKAAQKYYRLRQDDKFNGYIQVTNGDILNKLNN